MRFFKYLCIFIFLRVRGSKIGEHLISPGDCIQLKMSINRRYRYVNDHRQKLKVINIIDSEQNQIMIQIIDNNFYDFVDYQDVSLIKC